MSIKILSGSNGTPVFYCEGSNNYIDGIGKISGDGAVTIGTGDSDNTLVDIYNTSDSEEMDVQIENDSLDLGFHGDSINADLGDGDNKVYWDVTNGRLNTSGGDDEVITSEDSSDNYINLGSGENYFFDAGDYNLTVAKGSNKIYTSETSEGAVVITNDDNDYFDIKGSNGYFHAGDGICQVTTYDNGGNTINVGDSREIDDSQLETLKQHTLLAEFLQNFFA